MADALKLLFPWGMPGLEEHKKFNLSLLEAGSPFYYLRSVGVPEVGLLVINPFEIFKDYEFDLDQESASQLEITGERQAAVLCTVNTSRGIKKATVNLLAPVVINKERLIAKQVVLNDNRYSLRTPLNNGGGEGGEANARAVAKKGAIHHHRWGHQNSCGGRDR